MFCQCLWRADCRAAPAVVRCTRRRSSCSMPLQWAMVVPSELPGVPAVPQARVPVTP